MESIRERQERIAVRLIDEARPSIDFNGAADAVAAEVKRLTASWNVGDKAVVDLSAYGFPKGWKAKMDTVVGTRGETGLLVTCKTVNAMRRQNGAGVLFRSTEPCGDEKIRSEVMWVVKNTL